MKEILIATVFSMTFVSSIWAVETVDVQDRVNNAQTPAHQKMLSVQKSTV